MQTTQTISDQIKKKALQAYVDGLNAGDLDAVVDLYSDDARIEDPVGSEQVVVGKEAVRAFYERSLAMGLTVTLSAPIRGSHDDSAAMAFEVKISKSEPPMTIRVIDVMQFDSNGKIKDMKAYWSPEDVTV